jgi:acyl transferase domain-containing protein
MLGPGKIYETQISSHIETEKEMLPFFSSVTSETITDPSQLGASYWRRNLQSPVLFNGAIRSILDGSKISHSFVEIGPHSALAGPLRQIFKSLALKTDPIYIPTLTRHAEDSRSQILHTVGCNHVYGIEVNWESINGNGETLFNLPSYAWQHPARYWHESRLATAWRQRKWPHHEILGVRIAESTDLEPSWRNILRLEDVPWIWDHVLQGNIVFPAAGYIAMAGEAIRQLHPDVGDYSIKNLVLKSPLLLKDDQATEIITNFTPAKITDLVDSEWYNFTIAAHDGVGWTKQCQGQVRPHFDYAPSPKEIEQRIRPVESQQWYRALDRRGLSYGPTFRGLEAIAADPVKLEANATIANKIENCSSRYALHPTVIDQCLQLMSVALTNGVSRRMDRLAIPTAIGHLYITGNAPQMQLESQMTHSSIGSLLGSSTLKATDETLLLYLDQAAFFSVQDQSAKDPIPLISEIKWSPDIDLTKSELWITKPLTSGHVVEAVKDSARLSLLYVLETAEKVDYSVPSEPHMARYRDWLVRMASMIRSGHYHSCPDWLELVMMSSEARRAKILELYATWADHPDLCGLFIAPQAVYENYSEIASGKSSALEVLMDDGRLEKLYACVGSSEFWDYPLQLIGHANPRMRVLEVGAGTGSATKSALKNFITTDGVRLYSKYVFTDISPGFTVAAQEKFSTERHLEFKVLDISKDPEQQGFEPHTFDVIIASNVSSRLPFPLLLPF